MKTCKTCDYFYHIGSAMDVFWCDFLKRRFSKEDNYTCTSYINEKVKLDDNYLIQKPKEFIKDIKNIVYQFVNSNYGVLNEKELNNFKIIFEKLGELIDEPND